jgi:hypothetical protein
MKTLVTRRKKEVCCNTSFACLSFLLVHLTHFDCPIVRRPVSLDGEQDGSGSYSYSYTPSYSYSYSDSKGGGDKKKAAGIVSSVSCCFTHHDETGGVGCL